MVAGAMRGGGRNGELFVMGTEFQFCKMETILEIDGVDFAQKCECT